VIVRPARPEEREALEAIQRRASLALDAYREVLEANPDAIALPDEQVARGDVFVAQVDGRLAGFAALDGGEIDGLFVEAAVHEARRRGLSLVTVVAEPLALAFYESCGFRFEGKAETRFGPAIRMSR